MSYVYNSANSSYDQTVSLNGTVVSFLSTASGHAQGWGTAIECQEEACGTVPAHEYVDTTIKMSVADASYSSTVGTTGASGDVVTSDDGLTWTVSTMKIDSFTYT
jgi:hypothetical protein